MFSKFLFMILITLYGCGGSQEPKKPEKPEITIPSEQFNFSETLSGYKKDYKSASTDARKSKVYSLRNDFIDSNKKKKLNGWYGKVVDVTSEYLEVSCNGVKYTLENDALDYTLFDMKEDLLFSGIFDRPYWGDTPSSSGFYVKTHNITTYDKSKTYLSTGEYVKKIRNLDRASINGSQINAECTVNYTINGDQVLSDIQKVAYGLAKERYPQASSLRLIANLSYTNTYGEDKIKELGICTLNSTELRDLRRNKSSSDYAWDNLDCMEVVLAHSRFFGF